MESGKLVSGDKRLEQALETVRTSPKEAEKFAADPEGYLKNKGVNTEGLKFGAGHHELSDAELEHVAGGKKAPAAGVCGSVGCVACITVGN
jgi:hypothetical protein